MTTMESSIMRPTAAAIPPRVMILIVKPTEERHANVDAMIAGTTNNSTKLMRQLRRKRNTTIIASKTPTRMLSRVLSIELIMKSP